MLRTAAPGAGGCAPSAQPRSPAAGQVRGGRSATARPQGLLPAAAGHQLVSAMHCGGELLGLFPQCKQGRERCRTANAGARAQQVKAAARKHRSVFSLFQDNLCKGRINPSRAVSDGHPRARSSSKPQASREAARSLLAASCGVQMPPWILPSCPGLCDSQSDD